jgi:heme/copper-type cytochrome/quinol oxidase subunit 2
MITNYNAIQKIFKSRFDEGRSNTRLLDFSNFYNKQPYISSNRINYERLIGKNKVNFLNVNFYKSNGIKSFNFLYNLHNFNNFYFFDFPFLLSTKSDASRYLWLDWFSKWNIYEIQQAQQSRYGLYGMPYFNKSFEFNSTSNDNYIESETYLSRLSQIRRNYMPNWTFTPYLYSKNHMWFKNDILFTSMYYDDKINSVHYVLDNMSWYWLNINFLNFRANMFLSSNSNITTYNRTSWKPLVNLASYYYTLNTLSDVLSKREFLYRQFFENNYKIVNLPLHLTSSPQNPLISDFSSIYIYLNEAQYNNEFSKFIIYNNLNMYNLDNISYIRSNLIELFGFFKFFNVIFNQLTLNNLNTSNSNNFLLYKNQYKPLRKGVQNMIKLHTTGAVALPIEIRLQILASSKDVIHSWAVPSAGIKIDCVPGYSSHKVIIFLLSGIFWGQCMEICGRYHHWMPIIVYFMKRDLFFLWCLHFVFSNSTNNSLNLNDKFYSDNFKLTSFDKLTWLSELHVI